MGDIFVHFGLPKMTLVLLPGMDGTGQLFRPFLAHLSLDVKLIPLPVSVNQDFETLANEVAQQLPAEACILLFESFSSGLVTYLLEKKQNVCGVIFVAGFISSPKKFLCHVARFLPIKKVMSLPIVRRVFRQFVVGDTTDAVLNEIIAVVIDVPQALLSKRLSAITRIIPPRVKYETPTLCLQGRLDIVSNGKKYNEISSVFKNSSRVVLPTAHFVLQTHPRESAMLITDFAHSLTGYQSCHR